MDIEQRVSVLYSCSLFADVETTQLQALAALTEIVQLDIGANPFADTDSVRDVFVLVSGKLVATITLPTMVQQVVGYVLPGEVMAEMSFLAELPNTLTLSAVAPTQLLRIGHAQFHQFVADKPTIVFKLMEVTVRRTQYLLKKLRNPSHAQFIALLPASQTLELEKFIIALCASLPQQTRVIVLMQQDLHTDVNHLQSLLLNLRQQYDYIFYSIELQQTTAVRNFLQHYADKIVLLGQGDQISYLHPEIYALWQVTQQNPHQRTELILLYPDVNKRMDHVTSWLQQGNFFRYHHICCEDTTDMQRLARFMTGNAVGLVLSGGGVKGWVHIGAIKALLEAGIAIDAIGGASVGALVGALYLLTPDIETLIKKYHHVQQSGLKSLSLRELVIPLFSLFSGKTPTQILQQEFPGNIEYLPRPFFSISCNITRQIEVVETQGVLWEKIRATTSLPGLVPAFVQNHELYVDGGVMNNLPVDVMANFLENSGKIIAVSLSLSQENVANPLYQFPPAVSFWDTLLIKCGIKKDLHFPSLLATFLDALLMGSYAAQKENMHCADVLVAPDLSAYTTISKKDNAVDLMKVGYEATKKAMNNKL